MKKNLAALIFFLLFNNFCKAQLQRFASSADSMYYSDTKFRLVGPFRGGRANAVCGSLQNPQLFYMGSTGGGVWRTIDGGSNWNNISDKYFGGSIGSVAIAPSNENVIYVGEGENTMRGNVSEGINGIWKTDNAGRTWKNIGLANTRHITNILVHPRNENIVWACAMGSLFGASSDRGIYKTTDGGKTWKKVLSTLNNTTGAVEICAEPNNPDVLYASTWQIQRTPYSMESGGIGSGLYKSYDGGESWINISKNKGLPKDSILGISHIIVAPSNPDRVYAIIEAKTGGLYMSNDAGETWTLQSTDANIRQRAWYFSKINVDPKNQDVVYACNVEFWKSNNAGKNFSKINTPHGDHHNHWIDNNNAQRMAIADDGGVQISYDGGANWSSYYNQPTSQIYRISADNAWPYHLLGGQQDNSSVRIESRSNSDGIYNKSFTATAGGEAGVDVADPLNPDIVYGGEYAGILRRYDHHTHETRHINIWPESNIGSGAANLKYRFQWNYPLFFSSHNPKKIYAAANVLFSSEDEGQTWKVLSGDLTTNDKAKQQASGGPITKDNTTVEYYCTIFAATESELEKDVLYTGSDDGLLYVTKNGGGNWVNITQANMPKNMMWNCIETDPFEKGVAYAVGTCYKTNNFTPYIYKTNNYGATWQLATNGIAANHFTRVVRADKKRKNLLYCGTEYGMYISYNGGNTWQKFQMNLPIVPITDMCIKNNDLCIATQGRAIWALDNLTKVQAYNVNILNKPLHVWDINSIYFSDASVNENVKNAGQNPKSGVVIQYYLKQITDSTKLSVKILDANKKTICTYSTEAKEAYKIKLQQGNDFVEWDTYYPAEEPIKEMVLWNGGITQGPQAVPGKYYARVLYNNDSADYTFNIYANPNFKTTTLQYQDKFNFLMMVKNKLDSIQNCIIQLRAVRGQINDYTNKQGANCPNNIKQLGDTINAKLNNIEENLYQTKAKSGQDVLNYPIKLNDKIGALYNQAFDANTATTAANKEVFEVLGKQANVQLLAYNKVLLEDIKALNALILKSALPIIVPGK